MSIRPRFVSILLLVCLATYGFGATIQGTVVEDHNNAPVLSAGVRIHKTGAQRLAADLETDSQGRFEAPDLTEGEYRLEISKPNFLPASLRLNLDRGGSVAIAPVRLVRTGVITGRVTDQAGKPVAGATVFAIAKPPQGWPLRPRLETGRYATVDGSGRYRLYNLAPEHYFVAVSYGASTFAVGSSGSPNTSISLGSGFLLYPANERPEALEVSGGVEHRDIDFTVAPASLFSVSGKLQLPVPEARFWLALAPLEHPGLAVAVAPAEPDGSFHFVGVQPGSYHLFASGPTRARGGQGAVLDPEPFFVRARVDIAAQDVEGLSITPARGRSLNFALHAVNGGARCAATAHLVLSPLEDWGASLERRVPITWDRPETLPHLAPARYAVHIIGLSETCYAPPERVLDLSQAAAPDMIAIGAVPAGTIRGRLDAPGRRASDFSVILLPAGPVDSSQGARLAVPDPEFRFNFTGLRPGLYRIAARPSAATENTRAPSQYGKMVEIEVPAGSPLDVDLAIPRPPGNRP